MNAVTDPDDDIPPTDPAFLRARARTYDLLAACLGGDVERLAEAAAGDLARISSSLPVDLAPEPLADLDQEALSVGYDNLFEVPGPHYVPPFASAHATDPSADYESDSAYHAAEEGGELLGEPAAALSRLYAAAGFEPTHGDGIPDHVAAVFEFLGALAAAEAERREADEPAEADALRVLQRRTLAHLGWLDRFHEQVRSADSVEGAFARLVGIARSFAAWDAQSGLGASDTDESAPDQRNSPDPEP